MRNEMMLNDDWRFHLGEIGSPVKTVKKAGAIGGLTAPLNGENGEQITIGQGGKHFLNLISQGDLKRGLMMLAGTDMDSKLTEKWNRIHIPHDWSVDVPYVNAPGLLMSGSKPENIGYYRKTFSLDASLEENQILLKFDGVMRMASVWLNGIYLGDNISGYTPFEFDITEIAKFGDEGVNVLLVRADTTTGAEGWWYEGAGIYKEVSLQFLPKIYVDDDSFYIYTKEIGENAVLGCEATFVNRTGKPQTVLPTLHVGDQLVELDEIMIKPFCSVSVNKEFLITQPKLWTPETPHLYQATIQIRGEKQDLDEFRTTFGIRKISYDKNGFFLNESKYLLKGVCEHQDFAGVGVALNKDIVAFKLLKLKEMGVNAYRSAHHFASKDLLDCCDRLGIIVMNENRILETSPWRLRDLEKMVKRTRNHASLCFWSIANEEVIGNTKLGHRMAKRVTALMRSIDYEHLLVSAELLNPEGIVDEEYMSNFDVVGVNYPEAGVMGEGLKKIKAKYPEQPLMSTENASYFSTRGIYKDDEEKCQTNNFGSLYSMVLPGKRKLGDPGVGGTARPEEVLDFIEQNPYMGGSFIWTAFDYAGEPSPFGWPGISSQFGVLDTCGFEKDYFYYYQSKWTETPMVHVMPHWNKDGLTFNEDGKVEIRVFSNCDEVELFVNDNSQGKQPVGEHNNSWVINFIPGELKAIAYRNGEAIVSDARVTAKEAVDFLTEVIYDGETTQLVMVEAIDEDGNFVPMANCALDIAIKNGSLLGTGNGNPAYTEVDKKSALHLFSGKALMIVKKENKGLPKIKIAVADECRQERYMSAVNE